MATLKIAQLNARRTRRVTPEIRQKTFEEGIDILLLQEPYTYENTVPGFGMGNRVIKVDSSTPWAAIVILNPNITALRISQLCTTHMAVAEIIHQGKSMYIVSGYFQLSHDISVHLDSLEKVLTALRGKELLVGVDANAESPLWGPQATNREGQLFEDLIAQWHLSILNDPNGPATVANEVGEGFVDVTIATNQLAQQITNWKVRKGWTSSDHRVITMEVSAQPRNTRYMCDEVINGYNTRKANWESFVAVLSRDWLPCLPINSKAEAVQEVKRLNLALRRACNCAIPRKTKIKRKVPWWDEELTKTKKRTNKLRRSFQRSRVPEERATLKMEYRRARREYSRLINTTKEAKWREFVTHTGNDNPWSFVYKLQTRKIKPTQVASNIQTETGFTTSWMETMERMLSDLFPDDEDTEETEEQKRMRLDCANAGFSDSMENTESPFTMDEMKSAINKMKMGKAPGPDCYDLAIIKAALPIIGEDLLTIYNACLKYSVFPNVWKIGRVVTIYKGEDKDPSKPSSYRPICLLPILGKLLEALILNKISPDVERTQSERQYGFRKSRSTEDAIVKLREIVDRSDNKYVLAIFLDIKGAFDNVWWPSVLYELRQLNCNKFTYRLIQDYLSNRRVMIREGANEVQKRITKGCPQGSILGPTLWNLIFNKAITSLQDIDIETIAYADDQVIVIEGDSRSSLERKGQVAIDKVVSWGKLYKLTHAPNKCAMLLAKGHLHAKVPPVIRINGERIKRTESFKYLGVTYSTGLGVSQHIDNISRKTRSMFRSLGLLAKNEWGLGYRALTTIYKGLFVPIATYAAAGWYDKLTKAQKVKLIMTQRYALVAISGAYRTISAQGITTILGLTPIHLECERRTGLYKIRKGIPFTYEDVAYEGNNEEEERRLITRRTNRTKLLINKAILNKWQEEWISSDKGREIFKHLPDIRERLRCVWFNPSKWVIQLISGHGNFQAFRRRFNFIQSDECSCGGSDTPEHIMTECPKYEELRRKFARAIYPHEFNINSLIRKRNLCRRFTEYAKDLMQTKELIDALQLEIEPNDTTQPEERRENRSPEEEDEDDPRDPTWRQDTET